MNRWTPDAGRFLQCAVLIAATLLRTQTAHSADSVYASSVGQHGFMDSDWYTFAHHGTFIKGTKIP